MAKHKTLNDFDPLTFTTTAEGDDLSPGLLSFAGPSVPVAPSFSVPGDSEPIAADQSDPFSLPTGLEPVTRKRNRVAWLLKTTEPLLLTLAVVVLVFSIIVLLFVAATQLPTIISRNSPTQAVERFVAALNTGDKDKISATIDPEMRGDISGVLTDFMIGAVGVVGVKVKDTSYTEGATEGNVTIILTTGHLEYTVTSGLGEIVYRKGFTAEIAAVRRGEEWYVRAMNAFALLDSRVESDK
ncbi:MAG: hypothetical protein M3441_01375 [Chloroflexota bacterium]|nr:hypothetical protein [Chloroflexota bacterium]